MTLDVLSPNTVTLRGMRRADWNPPPKVRLHKERRDRNDPRPFYHHALLPVAEHPGAKP